MAVEEERWSYMPHDLLSKIADELELMDFLSFRCVCKDWHIASSKVSHEDKSSKCEPWFLVYEGEGSQCSLLSSKHKRYISHIPELEGAECLASCEGWLLLFREGSLFFFCPFSKAKIDLPNCPIGEVTDHVAAFSSAPTGQNCTVVVLNCLSNFELQLFMICRGEKAWTRHSYEGFNFITMRTALFYEGDEFHFLDGEYGLVSFRSKSSEWKRYYVTRSTAPSPNAVVLKYRISENFFQHHNNNGEVTFLEANDSISTVGTTVQRDTGNYDLLIGNESIKAPKESESRHFKGVWIKPKYCYVPPDQTW
ncbi:F-box protein At3g56470-like [Vigna radiata var. radiata]|uniref:F-box protein At3g56470-like n=1 Tax=Vigna radiata var. radiata TaxID=3916 RepID=A0A1S3VH76_VIGRR|nr:F-box protein At3g56470-like [Vigna radiata var. radiata]